MKDCLGIIGGLGPQATVLFYQMLIDHTAAKCDQEHINMVILSHATMPDRTEAILSDDDRIKDAVLSLLIEDAKKLEEDCTAVAIPCNTAHYFADELQKCISVPIINMIEETAEELSKSFAPGSRIAILATKGTVSCGLYQSALEKRGLVPWVPEESTQNDVSYEIFDCVKAGIPSDPGAFGRIDRDVRNAGCDAAVLACTELSVMAKELSLDESYYRDAMLILALRCIEKMGKEVR